MVKGWNFQDKIYALDFVHNKIMIDRLIISKINLKGTL